MASEDSYGTLTLKGTPITELRITDIKKELEKRGLPKSGSKIQLVDRLKGQLLLEKLQQDAAQSSGDEHEGKVPNMALQQDDKAGQSEFVRQYLQQQQRNLEIQMEMKKQVQEERKRKSADESSADEADIRASSKPDMTSPNVRAEDSNAPAKMSRPGRKSGRNSSKGENGPDGQQAIEKSKSPMRERSQSESSSSSHSPERSSRSRKGTRGRAKRGGSRRGGQHGRRGSRSSSPSSSPEVMPQKKQRRRTNSSSRSGSRSPQMVSPEAPTRRSSRRSSAALKSTSDQVQEEEMPHDGGDDKSKKVEQDEPTTPRKRWRKKPPAKVVGEPEVTHKIQEESVNTQSTVSPASVQHVPPDKSREGGQETSHDQASGDGGPVSQPEPAHSTETQYSDIPVTAAAPTSEAHKVATSPRAARDVVEVVTSNCKQETGAASVKVDQTNRAGETTASQDNAAARKVEAEKSSLQTEETKIQSSGKKKEDNVSSDTKKVMSPARTEKRDHHSPPPGERLRKSFSSDSSSSRSRSRSEGRRRAPSSSSSRSSSSASSGNSPVRRSSVGSQGKGRPGPAVTQAVPMEVDATEKDVPVAKNLRPPGKDAAAVSVSAPPTSEPRSSVILQENKQKLANKELEVKAQEMTNTQSKTPSEAEAAENVTHAEGEDEAVSKKGVKKRKWGSKTSKAAKTTKRTSSIEISSDVLKNLIGDVKLTETVFEMETEVVNTLDYDEHEEDRRDVRVKKHLSQSPAPQKEEEETKVDEEDARKVEARAESSPEPMEVEHAEPEKKIIRLSSAAPKVSGKTKLKGGKKNKEEKKKKQLDIEELKDDPVSERDNKDKMFATTRPIKPLLPAVDEPEPVSENQSPARNTPERVIRIAGLVRPFTVGQLKELLRRTGELDDEYFWINAIKSHCLAAYKRQEDAIATRAALHGTRWPQSNPKILIVDYATIGDITHRRAGGDIALLPAVTRQPQEEQKKAKVVEKVDDEKEKRLKAREQREKDRKNREKEAKERHEAKERKREPEKKNLIREWDRDKIQQMSRSRSKSREKDRVLRRSQDRDQRKRGQQTREKKNEERRKEKKQKDTKTEEEPPAKLLDDLFRKTKAVPCIYWLPLTEEQAQQGIARKQELEKERLKRIEERDKEELKKRETARLALQREREKANNKGRERERERGKQDRGRSRSRSRSRRRR